ncbi:KAP family NTPase [Pendulispora rubella]|uniref:KAP family NTPase n=1 Tax=Pendulispora rubella TaxID=2741070 RepID=A0ABZ2L569_9BACT
MSTTAAADLPEPEDQELHDDERRLFEALLDEVRRTRWFPERARLVQPTLVETLERLERRNFLTRFEDRTMWTLAGLVAIPDEDVALANFALAELGRIGALLRWAEEHHRHFAATNVLPARLTMDEVSGDLGWADPYELMRAVAAIAHEKGRLSALRLNAEGRGFVDVDLGQILYPSWPLRGWNERIASAVSKASETTIYSGGSEVWTGPSLDEIPASEDAVQALHIARRLAMTREPQRFTSSCIFFGLTEHPRAGVEGSAPHLLREHLHLQSGESNYLAVRDRLFPHADRALSNEATPNIRPTPRAAAILQRAQAVAKATTRENSIHLRHLLAAILEEAEYVPSSPSGLDDLVSDLRLDVVELRKKLLAWLPGNAPGDDMDAWHVLDGTNDARVVEETDAERFWSIHRSPLSDIATREDLLGFSPYVNAVASFLQHPDTKPPLTMSVEGKWGSGKTSFMLQLEDALKAKSTPAEDTPVIVRFDAWRHAKSEELWATFAVHFLEQVSRQQTMLRRLRGDAILFWRRIKWREARLEVGRAIIVGIVAVVLVLILSLLAHRHWSELGPARQLVTGHANKTLLDEGLGALILSGGGLGAFALILATLIQVKTLAGGVVPLDAKKHIASPDYDRRAAFLDQFHDDFAKIVEAYVGHRRVYVFVDDLDRCEVPTAVDLMQALNLMTACAPKVIFIIGMDRQRVAAGVAAKYAPLIPYLGASTADIAFGFEFLEKFIQLPLELPRPDEAGTRCMLWQAWSGDRMCPLPPPSGELSGVNDFAPSSQRNETREPSVSGMARRSPAPVAASAEQDAFNSAISTDSRQVRDITLAAARAFDFNPRKVKQFLNLFRLRAFIAWQTGRLELGGSAREGRMTLSQLADQTALTLRCPMRDMAAPVVVETTSAR